MKKAHTQARKANRGKRSDAPMKGLKVSESTFQKQGSGFKTEIVRIPSRILHHTLVQPRTDKPAFLRRNELIKPQDK